jgi:hypothetical protein
MKQRFKYSDNIERYLSHEMEYAEQRSFEKEIARNSTLAAELELTRNIDETLKQDDLIDLRLKLVYARNESLKAKSDIPVVHIPRKKFWYAAASLVLLASLGAALFFNNAGKNSNEELFRKYYSSENIIDVTRSGDANIVEAIIKFQEKDYPSSASLFGQILQKDTVNFAGWFFYGISCIETQQFAKAETAFNTIIVDKHNLYVEHAEWYLGLCYLKSNQSIKAKQQLNLIASNSENFHRNEARHLLEKLSQK